MRAIVARGKKDRAVLRLNNNGNIGDTTFRFSSIKSKARERERAVIF